MLRKLTQSIIDYVTKTVASGSHFSEFSPFAKINIKFPYSYIKLCNWIWEKGSCTRI